MGGLFVLLGLGAYVWGRVEEKRYLNSLSSRSDVREYLEHWPQRPEPGALKTGAWIAVTIGLLLLVLGVVFVF
jgi:hypothetical protein